MAKKRTKTNDWKTINEKILSRLDLQAEFLAMGVDVVGEPRENGWAECHSVDRDDQNPSAAVNVVSGRYRDLGGEGLSLSFWDLCVHLKKFPCWQDAREHYAAKASVRIDTKSARDPAEHLVFQAWVPSLIALWCRNKPGVTPEAIRAAGGRVARYRDQYTVIALPVFGPGLSGADPIGWVLWNATGKELPIFRKDKKTGKSAVSWKKMKTTGGSEGGFIGLHAVNRLSSPDADVGRQIVWKVEGPSDLLSLWAIIPPDKRNSHLVITNSDGAAAAPQGWMATLITGRNLAVIGDADTPGQAGAAKWASWAAPVAAETRIITPEQMGFELSANHGRDLRDWIAAGHTYDDLLALVDGAQRIEPTEQKNTTKQHNSSDSSRAPNNGAEVAENTEGPAALEADDDPHRLARVNLERYATRTEGRTIVYWRDEWYVWKRNSYRKISKEELRAKLSSSIKKEFDRLNCEQLAMAEESSRDGGEPPQAKRVTMAIVSNVMQATSGMVCVSADVEPNTWLPEKQPRRYISMENGLVDIDAILADSDDYIRPNTPEWFSMVSLPYAFDPDATCPRWDSFLEHNLELDPERIKVAQEWAGYVLSGNVDEQKFMILEGEGGNGKSVFIAGLTAMLGVDNVSNVPLENLGERFQAINTIGKLLNAAGDCGEIDKTAEGMLKSFTSGDRMYFDRKSISGVNCTPTARLMIACNNRPRFSDRSDGIWRRMLVVPWRIAISPERRVKGMDKITWWQASGELPGIFLWALRGLARLRAQGGFTASEEMRRALAEYQEEMNPARSFLAENLEEAGTGFVRASQVYRFYKKWAEENGYRPLSERVFGKEIKRVFGKSDRVRRGSRNDRFWAYDGLQFSRDEIGGEQTSEAILF